MLLADHVCTLTLSRHFTLRPPRLLTVCFLHIHPVQYLEALHCLARRSRQHGLERLIEVHSDNRLSQTLLT